MKILITGYKGFIGHNMVYALKDEHELFFFEWGDSFPDLQDIDVCIHLGAISSTTETDIEKVLEQNYDFSRWLVNACNYWNVKFQYASSASIYGLSSNFSEGAPADPRSPYAWSKFLFDRYLDKMYAEQRFKIDIQGFRYFNVYGPHEDHKDQPSPHFKFEKQAKETGVIQLFENSDQYFRDFVPVQTVIDVHKAFFDIKESGIWNLGTGVATSFESVARSIAEKYNARIEYIPMPENIALQYQKYTCADLTNLKQYYDPSNG